MKLPQAVQSCHELLIWMIPHIHKFPRQFRFTLGERLENRLLSVLEELLDAAYSKQPLPALQRANRHLDLVAAAKVAGVLFNTGVRAPKVER